MADQAERSAERSMERSMERITSHERYYVVRVGQKYLTDGRGGVGAFARAMHEAVLERARKHAARAQLKSAKLATPPDIAVVRVTIEEIE